MGLSLVTAPESYPVSLVEAKAHLRVEHEEHDTRISLYIAGETGYAESFMGRALVPQVWDYTLDAFPAAADPQIITLPMPKVISVDGVFYQDTDLAEQEWDAASYIADVTSDPARIGLASGVSWPTPCTGLNAIRIRFTTGYLDATVSPALVAVREDIKIAILLRVQATYQGGENADKLRDAAEIYLRRHRNHLALA
jgi:uncharacterized phiE125 gp8 family phage protein